MRRIENFIRPMPGRRSIKWAFVARILAFAGAVRSEDGSAPRIIYVHQAATGANDGTSWADAYTDLQDALDGVVAGDGVWVAEGTYRPDRGTADRYARYDLRSGISLYGSFAGWESCPDERVIADHPTILDGDLLGNDDLTVMPTSDCCTLNPFSHGCENDECAQAVVALGGPYDTCLQSWSLNCVEGAGIACGELCRPTRSDNSIRLVNIRDAEGIVIDGFTFARADGFCHWSQADCDLPAALSIRDSRVTLANCRLIGHRSLGGAALSAQRTTLMAERCVFEDNLRGLRSTPSLASGTAVSLHQDGENAPSSFRECVFRNNAANALSCSGIAQIDHCRFVANHGGLGIGGSHSPFVHDCVFLDNFDTGLSIGAPATVANCVLLRNHRGIAVSPLYPAVIANTVVAGGSGTGIYADWASLTLLNSVVYGNRSRGVVVGSGHIANCIIRGNTDSFHEGEDAQLDPNDASPTLRYNSIEGWTGALGGVGNVDVEPMFVDPDGPDDIPGTEDDDFHLALDSPLINFGDPNPPLAPYLDGEGHARILCGRIDMGAYEFGIGDYNCDRAVELDDYVGFSDCLTGPAPVVPYPSACAAYDFVTEITEDVDLLDFAGFQNAPFSDGP